jgi:hypothetical protein
VVSRTTRRIIELPRRQIFCPETVRYVATEGVGTTSIFRSVQEDVFTLRKMALCPTAMRVCILARIDSPGSLTHTLFVPNAGVRRVPRRPSTGGRGYPPEGVWLHRECARFWSPAPASPRAKVESTPASAGTGNGDVDPWADLDIPAYLNRQDHSKGRVTWPDAAFRWASPTTSASRNW